MLRLVRGVGTGGGGGRAPQVFKSALFPGSKVPFTSVKNVVQISFFAQRPLFNMPGKLQMSRDLQVYMAWTVKSDESIRFLERSSDMETRFKNLHSV
jgi:hypothetical protein